MAVQAQYPSNAFSPDLCSRAQAGIVLEGIQMWQNREHQNEHLINEGEQQPAPIINVTTLRDHSHIEPTYNFSVAGRWSRFGALPSSMATPAISLTQQVQPGISNPAFFAMPGSSSTVRLPMCIDPRLRMFETASTSTSGRQENVSVHSAPGGASFSQELLAQITNHNVELDTILNNYKKMLHAGIEETQRRYCKSLVAILEQKALKRIQEKDAELENVNRKNSELEEKILQLCSESQMLFNHASHNEALISSLKATLEQVLLGNTTPEAAPVAEGYGDTDGIPFPANDAQSCFNLEDLNAPKVPGDTTALEKEEVPRHLACKVCQEKKFSVLVLPCRHLCLCKECEPTVAVCPICNNPKNCSLHVFIP